MYSMQRTFGGKCSGTQAGPETIQACSDSEQFTMPFTIPAPIPKDALDKLFEPFSRENVRVPAYLSPAFYAVGQNIGLKIALS
jgi:hypothetical protein